MTYLISKEMNVQVQVDVQKRIYVYCVSPNLCIGLFECCWQLWHK